MSEERLEEIQDSVDFQREFLLANNLGTLSVDEEQELIDEIERLNNIINEFEERCKFFNEMSNEKQNRIDRCMTFNNYILHESWYGGNEKKYAQRNINILLGKETELKEIPRVGSDKE